MDMNDLGKSFGIGLLVGLLFMFFSTVVTLPASYYMNRFIYHSGSMRFLLMMFSVVLAPVFFVILILGRIFGLIAPTHYFGLFPVFFYETPKGDVVGWYALLQKAWIFLLHPFVMFYQGDDDMQGFIKAVETLKGKKDEERVNEKLYAAAREVGTLNVLSEWADEIQKIQSAFGIKSKQSVSIETCNDDVELAKIIGTGELAKLTVMTPSETSIPASPPKLSPSNWIPYKGTTAMRPTNPALDLKSPSLLMPPINLSSPPRGPSR
jgi:hypothetical protein